MRRFAYFLGVGVAEQGSLCPVTVCLSCRGPPLVWALSVGVEIALAAHRQRASGSPVSAEVPVSGQVTSGLSLHRVPLPGLPLLTWAGHHWTTGAQSESRRVLAPEGFTDPRRTQIIPRTHLSMPRPGTVHIAPSRTVRQSSHPLRGRRT